MATEVERLVIRLIGDTLDYTDSIEKVIRQNKKLVNAVGTLKEQLNSLTVIMGLTNDFSAFNKALTESQAIISMTANQSEKMKNQALELGAASNKSSTEIAKGYFYLASAGLNVNQQLAAMPIIVNFATSGLMGLERATSLASDAQSALGLKVADTEQYMRNLTRVTDVLVKANVLANANVEQFSIALTSKAGASLKSVNKEIEEGVAVLAAMADQGIKGEVAGNALSRMLLLLKKSALDNAKAQEFYGLKVYDNTGKMKNLADIIENLEKITEGMTDEAKAAAFEYLGFTARIQAFILPLMGTSQKIRQYEKELKMAGGTTKEVSDKILSSFSSQLEIVKNSITNLSIGVGKELARPMMEVGKLISWVAKIIFEFDKTTYSSIAAIIALVAQFVAFITVVKLLGYAFALLQTASVSLWATFAANPVAAFAITIASLIVGLDKLIQVQTGYNNELQKSIDLTTQLNLIKPKAEINKIVEEANKETDPKKKLESLKKALANITAEIGNASVKLSILEKHADENSMSVALMETLGKLPGSVGDYFGSALEPLKQIKKEVEEKKKLADDLLNKVKEQEKVVIPDKSELEISIRKMYDDLNEKIDNFGLTEDQIKLKNFMEKAAKTTEPVAKGITLIQLALERLEKAKAMKELNEDLDKLKERMVNNLGLSDIEQFILKHKLDRTDPEDMKKIKEAERIFKIIRKEEERQGLERRAEEIKDRYMLPEDKLKKGTEELNKLLEMNLITVEQYDLAMNDLKKTLLGVSDAQKELNSSMSYGNSESFRFIYEYMSGFGNRNKPNFVKKNFDFGPKMKNVLAMNVDTDNQGKNAIDLLSKAVGYLEEIAGGEGTPLSLANLS